MDQRKTKAFFEGRDIHAYNIFGAHLEANGVRFRVYAPNAKNISVIGTFNDWDDQASKMKKDKRGIWECFVEGAKNKDSYKYRVWQANGELVDKMDPYAFYSELRPNTASIVSDLSYDGWTDKKWLDQRNKGFDSPVNIYEMHVGSWRKDDENEEFVQYHEIEKELIEHCKKHHFTHVEVMPLCEYPFDGSWGYQCTGYFSSTSRYGTNHELMHFVNALHEAGIGVIMDFVPVHFVKDNYALGMFDGTPLYEYSKPEDANSEWGTANFNLWKEEVRSFLMSAANFWIDVYHVDGLRMDAISNAIFWHGNKNNGVNEGACDFMKRMNHLLNEEHQGKIMLIAEDSSDFPNVTKPSYAGGLGFDYKWDLGWMNDTLRYYAMDPIYRKYHHNDLTFSMAYFYSERFLLPFSHDEVVHSTGLENAIKVNELTQEEKSLGMDKNDEVIEEKQEEKLKQEKQLEQAKSEDINLNQEDSELWEEETETQPNEPEQIILQSENNYSTNNGTNTLKKVNEEKLKEIKQSIFSTKRNIFKYKENYTQ